MDAPSTAKYGARQYSDTLDFRLTDTSLRDGSHAKRHRFTTEHVRDIVSGLDSAGVPVIEVTHGDGLGGSSYNYGFSLTDERELMATAVKVADTAKIAALDASGRGHEGRHQVHRRRWACRSCGSRPTAPKRTSPSSTSASPASWASRPSAS